MLYLLRHGDIDIRGDKRFIGWTDIPLSPSGRARIAAMGQQLRNIDFSEVWSSPLQRARETADIIAGALDVRLKNPVRVVPQLTEINLGKWDGALMSDIQAQYPELWRERGENIDTFRPPEGESFSDLRQRVIPFVTDLAARGDDNRLIVTHAGVIRVLLCHMLNAPLHSLFRIHIDYGGLTLICFGAGLFQIKAVNIGATVKNHTWCPVAGKPSMSRKS